MLSEVARMGRPNKALLIGEADRLQLHALVRSRSMPHSLVRRARIVLLSGEGQSNREVARRCGVSAPAASHWRRRYQERGLAMEFLSLSIGTAPTQSIAFHSPDAIDHDGM